MNAFIFIYIFSQNKILEHKHQLYEALVDNFITRLDSNM